MNFDKRLVNVLVVGFAFLLTFVAFQTMGNIEKVILDSVEKEDHSFKGDAYTSLAIIYATFSILNWAVPSVISLIGCKFAMVYGATSYLFFILTFLWPKTWLLYVASVVVGSGAPMIWTGQGTYLTQNSTKATISRNSGIFWAMLQCSMFVGNLYVFFQFQDVTVIHKDTRDTVMWVLSAIALAGLVVFLFLPASPKTDDEVEKVSGGQEEGPLEVFKGAVNLFFTKRMILLSVSFVYTGLELGFYSGVYSSSIGFTLSFDNPKQLVGLSGIFIGIGEVLGGALFGLLGNKTTKWGRDPVVIAGFILHILSFFLIFVNLPDQSPFGDTHDAAFITSSAPLAIFCSFLLGFGDACFNTQIYSMLGSVFADRSSSAFAIFKFTQSVAAAACFFYASHLALYGQLGILIAGSIIGTSCFVWVEWEVKKETPSINSDDVENSSISERSS